MHCPGSTLWMWPDFSDARKKLFGLSGNFLCALLLSTLFMLCGGCARSITDNAVYSTNIAADIPLRYTPSFLIENPDSPFNRIGTPVVTGTPEQPEFVVDPDQATIYYEECTFTTSRASYKNLVYRIHFNKIPFGWGQFNLTAGNNPGILIIYTLSMDNRLLLITTLHTCGCYLAFFPTENLSTQLRPDNWPQDIQSVYGYSLPAALNIQDFKPEQRVLFTLADGTHRIKRVELSDPLANVKNPLTMAYSKMSDLFSLPFDGKTFSFFEMDGPRAGYVKNSSRPLERLLISWWAFDFHVGEDKAYGGGDVSKTPLYTSLKFWNRESSDLKNFPAFLSFWGWKL